MRKTHLTLLSAFLAYFAYVNSQTCTLYDTCTDCIRATQRCVWCSKRDFSSNQKRCQPESVANDGDWCDPDPNSPFIENPMSNLDIQKNESFSSSVQIRPQTVAIDMHSGESYKLRVTAQRAPNAPLDLYYLMDVSNTMADDLERLKKLAEQLNETVSKLTKNYRLGFGTFVDKPILPFTDTSAEKIGNPCFGRGGSGSCPPAYSFRNTLPLSANPDDFVNDIQNETTSGNLDIPEGMLDALMQVVVCDEVIKWRKDALHMVVIATDEQFHIAGDGKFAGIYDPNDGKCHTTPGPGGMYTKATELDYPSVSQIKQALFDQKVNPIFLVTDTFTNLYNSLVSELAPEVVASRESLSNDSSNILSLIPISYEQIASRVGLTVSVSGAQNVDGRVTVVSCADAANKIEKDGCKDIKIGERATFDVTLTLKECIDNQGPILVTIDAAAFGRTEVTINPLCTCGCSASKSTNDPYCNSAGTLECGRCTCNTSWAGLTCNRKCDPTQGEDVQECRGNGTEICSGNGDCICGQCECFRDAQTGNPSFVGDLCQCPRSRCRNAQNGQECGGPNQGTCVCGPLPNGECSCDCQCVTGFRSQGNFGACDCNDNNANCLTATGLECANHGTCECNRCVCEAEYDDGGKCEQCQAESCTDLCNLPELKACVVSCLGSSKKACLPTTGCQYDITVLANATEPAGTRICAGTDDLNCDYRYAVGNRGGSNNTRRIYILDDGATQCPASVNIVPIVIGIVFGILLIGIALLLLWWLLARLAAYREYKAFEKDRANASWTQTTSPLYQPPLKNYQNPTYKKKQT
ncbi:integrin beta-2-like [Oscarella lobularis]|uniref:integrin beta-2-like n=1 Tax=Oscarella lobularis TaxID=121494 RepID=UPI003313EACA